MTTQEIIAGITALLVVIGTIYTAARSARNDGYDQLEKVAARQEKQIAELISRVTALEVDKDNLQAEIVALKVENAQLRARLDKPRGLALK